MVVMLLNNSVTLHAAKVHVWELGRMCISIIILYMCLCSLMAVTDLWHKGLFNRYVAQSVEAHYSTFACMRVYIYIRIVCSEGLYRIESKNKTWSCY